MELEGEDREPHGTPWSGLLPAGLVPSLSQPHLINGQAGCQHGLERLPEAREGLIHAMTGVVLHVLWEEVSPLTPPLLET